MRGTITEATVKKAASGFLRDDQLIGFGLRTTASGAKSFFVEARVKGQPRRFTIGSAQHFTVAEARKRARTLLQGMHEGYNPQLSRRADRERSDTLRALLHEYVSIKAKRKEHPLRASTIKSYETVVQRCLGDWLDRPLDEITQDMVAARYEQLLTRSVSDANKAMRVLRAISRRAMRSLAPES